MKSEHTAARSRPLQPHDTEGETEDLDRTQSAAVVSPTMERSKVSHVDKELALSICIPHKLCI